MIYYFQEHEVRKYIRRNRETLDDKIVAVSNRNNLTIDEHIRLLNLNDDKYEYISFLGIVENSYNG